MDLINSKIVALVTLGLSSLFVGLLPLWISRHGRQQWPLLLSSLLCFGAGVLMSTSLIHMLPELREAMIKNKEYAELILCCGFFILYMIDEIVHFFYGPAHAGHHSFNHSHGIHSHQVLRRHTLSNVNKDEVSNYGATENSPLLSSEHIQQPQQPPYNPNFTPVSCTSSSSDDFPPSQLCHVGHEEPCHVSPISNIGLLLALSIHAILEGLAVGLQTSSSEVLLLLGAIASHKLVVGFCLGIELTSSEGNTPCRHFTSISIFSFGSSAGIGIGMAITNLPKTLVESVFPILQGLAAGTLLYVTVSEVLPRERARWHQHHNRRAAGVTQFLSVVFGFVMMTLLTKYLDFDH